MGSMVTGDLSSKEETGCTYNFEHLGKTNMWCNNTGNDEESCRVITTITWQVLLPNSHWQVHQVPGSLSTWRDHAWISSGNLDDYKDMRILSRITTDQGGQFEVNHFIWLTIFYELTDSLQITTHNLTGTLKGGIGVWKRYSWPTYQLRIGCLLLTVLLGLCSRARN